MDRNGFGNGRIWKVLAVGATVLFAGVLAVFLWFDNRAAQERQMANMEMEQELRPLELEKHRLQQELNDIKNEFSQETRRTGSLVLLFTNLDEQIYTDIYPIMEAFGYTGVVTLSEECFPGGGGCMSREQFRELMDAGWECCLKWEEEQDVKDWASACGRLARGAGVARPKAVYFPGDTYDSEKDELLIGEEVQTAIYHGAGETSLLASEIGGDIWHPGAMGWEQRGASKMLDEAVEQKGNLVFTIGTDFPEEEYEKDSFISMLEKADIFCEDGNLKVMTLSEARDYRQGLDEGRENLTEAYDGERAELEARIEELERQMDDITEKYR